MTPPSKKVNITPEMNFVVPGFGPVTGEFYFYPGYAGSYWNEPEPPTLLEIKLLNSEGLSPDFGCLSENDEEEFVARLLDLAHKEECWTHSSNEESKPF